MDPNDYPPNDQRLREIMDVLLNRRPHDGVFNAYVRMDKNIGALIN